MIYILVKGYENPELDDAEGVRQAFMLDENGLEGYALQNTAEESDIAGKRERNTRLSRKSIVRPRDMSEPIILLENYMSY